MANNKQRYVNTRFWNDNYISELDPLEKLLFMYFLTNEHTNISGVYELPLKIVAVETGLDKTMLEKMIPRLKDKIGYIRGFVVIKNFLKHQETRSPLTLKGIENCLTDLDQEWLKELINKGDYIIEGIKFEGVCKGYARVSNYSYSNLDSNLDSNSISAVADEICSLEKDSLETQEESVVGKRVPSRQKGTTLVGKRVHTKERNTTIQKTYTEQSSGIEIGQVIDSFKDVNETAYKKWYARPPQRQSVDRMLALHGLDKVLQVVGLLGKTNKQPYFPKIMSPIELEDKWDRLKDTLISKKTELKDKQPKYII